MARNRQMRKGEWISVAAAARILQRSPRTIRRWVDEGRLEARQLRQPGGWVEISVESVENVLTEAGI